MKSLAFVFACLVSVSASAQQFRQDDDIRILAQQVNMLVQNNLRALPGEHRQYVRESLQGIIQTFAMNGVNVNVGGSLGPLPPPPPPLPGYQQRQLFCDSNGNILNDLATGRIVYDFSSLADCNTAKEQIRRGEPFCDSNDNVLHSSDTRIIYDFSSLSDCNEARVSVYQGRGFCDSNDNTLHRANGSLVYDFSSLTDCKNALREML